MVKRAMGWFGVVALCAVFGGCKSGDDAAAPISQDQLPGVLAGAVCDSLGSCCAAASFVFDSTNCRAAGTAELKATIQDMLTPAVKYDAQAAGDCMAELKGRIKCGDTNAAEDIPACDRVFVGTLAAGQTCTKSAECVAPGYCNQDFTTGQSVCTAPTGGTALVRGKAGDTCSASCADATSCNVFQAPVPGPPGTVGDPTQPAPTLVACYGSDSLYCDGTCQKLKAIGESCSSPEACQTGLFCDFNSAICTAPHPNGAVCSSDYECQSDHCSADPATGADGTCSNTSVTAQQCANGSR